MRRDGLCVYLGWREGEDGRLHIRHQKGSLSQGSLRGKIFDFSITQIGLLQTSTVVGFFKEI